jgi:hypothetical protein
MQAPPVNVGCARVLGLHEPDSRIAVFFVKASGIVSFYFVSENGKVVLNHNASFAVRRILFKTCEGSLMDNARLNHVLDVITEHFQQTGKCVENMSHAEVSDLLPRATELLATLTGPIEIDETKPIAFVQLSSVPSQLQPINMCIGVWSTEHHAVYVVVVNNVIYWFTWVFALARCFSGGPLTQTGLELKTLFISVFSKEHAPAKRDAQDRIIARFVGALNARGFTVSQMPNNELSACMFAFNLAQTVAPVEETD